MTTVRPDTSPALPPLLPGAGQPDSPVTVTEVAEADPEAVTGELVRHPGARLADLFAAGTDPVTLRAIWALDFDRRYLITETPVSGPRYPALSDIAPAVKPPTNAFRPVYLPVGVPFAWYPSTSFDGPTVLAHVVSLVVACAAPGVPNQR